MAIADPVPERVLRVSGTGTAEADADRCIVHVVLLATADTTGDALTELAGVVSRSVAVLHQEGVAEGAIRTMNVTLEDKWDRSRDRIVGRSASYRMRIAVTGLERAGALLSSLAGVAGDSLEVQNLELCLSDPDALARSARRAAVLDARSKAGELAAAAGVILGEVLSIADGPFQGERGRFPALGFRAMAASSAPPIPPVPVEGGPLSVTSVVTLVYRIA
jgi:uncharacterized protein